MRRTDEPAAESQVRELTAHIRRRLHDFRGPDFTAMLDPVDYSAPRDLARSLRDGGSDGIVYPSVRWPAGEAVALFWPDLVQLPVIQARHLLYHWSGTQVDRYFVYSEDAWYSRPAPASDFLPSEGAATPTVREREEGSHDEFSGMDGCIQKEVAQDGLPVDDPDPAWDRQSC